MPERTNEEVVRAYLGAMEAKDIDAVSKLRHPDFTSEWPQSGCAPFEAPAWRAQWVERMD